MGYGALDGDERPSICRGTAATARDDSSSCDLKSPNYDGGRESPSHGIRRLMLIDRTPHSHRELSTGPASSNSMKGELACLEAEGFSCLDFEPRKVTLPGFCKQDRTRFRKHGGGRRLR